MMFRFFFFSLYFSEKIEIDILCESLQMIYKKCEALFILKNNFEKIGMFATILLSALSVERI